MRRVRLFCVGCGRPECRGDCPERAVLDRKVEADIRQWEHDQRNRDVVPAAVLDAIKAELDKIVEKR